jgi:hypothetical protein
MSDEAFELFVARRMAELMVERWDRASPITPASYTSGQSNWRRFQTRLAPMGREPRGPDGLKGRSWPTSTGNGETATRPLSIHRPSSLVCTGGPRRSAPGSQLRRTSGAVPRRPAHDAHRNSGRRSPRKLLRAVVARLLGHATRQIANDPISYGTRIRAVVPSFDVFQDVIAEATRGVDARHVLDLGIGTGETARRVLELRARLLRRVFRIDPFGQSSKSLGRKTGSLAGSGGFHDLSVSLAGNGRGPWLSAAAPSVVTPRCAPTGPRSRTRCPGWPGCSQRACDRRG